MSRNVVTSENRAEFMAKKLGLDTKKTDTKEQIEKKVAKKMRELGISHKDPNLKHASEILKRHQAESSGQSDKSSYWKYEDTRHKGLTDDLRAKNISFDEY